MFIISTFTEAYGSLIIILSFLLCYLQITKDDKKYWFAQGKMLSSLSVLRNILPLMRRRDFAIDMYKLFQQNMDAGQVCPQYLVRQFSDLSLQSHTGKYHELCIL